MRITAEVRWFWRGEPPGAFQDWFTGGSAHRLEAGESQTRTDAYLREPAQDTLGIKKRGGDTIEIKGLIDRRHEVLVLAECNAPMELWAKWSSKALNLDDADLVPVKKRRRMRRFGVEAQGVLELTDVNDGAERQRGCDAELTVLTIADETWWTFGFEAFGAIDSVARDLARTVAVLDERRPPHLPASDMAGGYPAWLGAHAR